MSLSTESNGHADTPREIAAYCLGAGRTHKVAAQMAAVCERQVYRWQKDPEFRRLVSFHHGCAVSETQGFLAKDGKYAARRLGRLARDENPQVALPACTAILTIQIRLAQHQELAERVAALEARADEQTRDSGW
jgi:hypothetical protein